MTYCTPTGSKEMLQLMKISFNSRNPILSGEAGLLLGPRELVEVHVRQLRVLGVVLEGSGHEHLSGCAPPLRRNRPRSQGRNVKMQHTYRPFCQNFVYVQRLPQNCHISKDFDKLNDDYSAPRWLSLTFLENCFYIKLSTVHHLSSQC